MRGVTTEYRESYCWIQPCKSRRGDNFDELIRKKVQGGGDSDDNGDENSQFDQNGCGCRNGNGYGSGNNGNSGKGFTGGLSLEDCIPEKTPKPKDKVPTPTPMADAGNTINNLGNNNGNDGKPKNFGRKSMISGKKSQKSRKSTKEFNDRASTHSGSSFCNFGQGNSTRLNPKFNYTTYNVQAGDGINPNTLIRSGCRNYALKKYSRPFDSQSVHIYRPGFFASVNDAPEEIREELQGPFWVSWPENTPVPDEYIELKPVLSL